MALAQIGGKPVVSLPGNPVSAYAVFAMLVSPLMRRMQGREDIFPPVNLLPLRTDHPRQDGREEFLRVQRRVAKDGTAELVPYGHQGSGVISSLPWATGLARLPADVLVNDGDRVPYYDMRHWLA
ncbi:Molybdopterin molybdenumtransferase [compost metagenome]